MDEGDGLVVNLKRYGFFLESLKDEAYDVWS
jgi:hypothetical protein